MRRSMYHLGSDSNMTSSTLDCKISSITMAHSAIVYRERTSRIDPMYIGGLRQSACQQFNT
ncbi:hypothetical protein CAY99_04035 [Pseudomonas aeruginosa]|nr:hypothetical protein CAY99_04035 [Pseudomonas aeruginosa]